MHTRQPLPEHITHCMSTSADGSVKGKNDGRKRTPSGFSKNTRRNSSMVPLRSAKLMFSSTSRPSTWWNIGEWVISESQR
ncbi:hypothetical protein D3C78_1854630 [compost metagenome]